MFSRVVLIGAVIAAAQAGLLGFGHGGNHGPQYDGYNHNSALGTPGLYGPYSGPLRHSEILSHANSLEFNSPFAHRNYIHPNAGILSQGLPLGHVGHVKRAFYPSALNGVGGHLSHDTSGRAISHVDRTDVIQTSPVGYAGAAHLAGLGHGPAVSPALNLANSIPHAHVSNVILPAPALRPAPLASILRSDFFGQATPVSHASTSSHLGSLSHAAPIPHAPNLVYPAPYSPAIGPLAHSEPSGHSAHLGNSSPLSHTSSPLAPIASLGQSSLAHPAAVSNDLSSYGYARQYAGAQNYFSYPKYQYSYSVEDSNTGDHKTQQESRDGDVVKGEYSLAQPDGSFRKVSYAADDRHGFNAVVQNSGPSHHVYSSQYHQKW